MSKKQKVSLIGIGRWGKKILEKLYQQSEIMYVVSNTSFSNATYIRKIYPDLKLTTNLEEVLQNQNIKTVFIATPIDTHYKIATKALSYGKNTFVEKPLSTKLCEVKSLYTLAKKNKCKLSTGYLHLHDPAIHLLKRHVLNESKIKLRMVWNKYGTFDSCIVTNLLVHDIAVTLELLGEIKNYKFKINQNDVLHVKIYCERGVSDIYINRKSRTNKKELFLETGSNKFTVLENGLARNGEIILTKSGDLLEKELGNFLQNKSSCNTRKIDFAIARFLQDTALSNC